MLYLAHKEHGRLAWSGLFGDAEQLADDGFVVSPRLDCMIHLRAAPQPGAPDAVRLFHQARRDRAEGRRRAEEPGLRRDADSWSPPRVRSAILTGRIAARHRRSACTEDPLPGTMTLADLAAYKPHESDGAVPALPRLPGLHRQAAVRRPGAAGGARPPRAHRHRHARPGRPAGLAADRRGRAADVRRPRHATRATRPSSACRSRACSTRPISPSRAKLIGDDRRPAADARPSGRRAAPTAPTAPASPAAPRTS